jgi:Fur family ferric uptake transcriptional regulator
MALLQTLADHKGEHLSAREITESVRSTDQKVDTATVYRTLELFTKLHIVTEIKGATGISYQIVPVGGKHNHIVCEECGTTFDYSSRYLEGLRTTLVQDLRFELHLEHSTLSGVCEQCQETFLSRNNIRMENYPTRRTHGT